MKTAH